MSKHQRRPDPREEPDNPPRDTLRIDYLKPTVRRIGLASTLPPFPDEPVGGSMTESMLGRGFTLDVVSRFAAQVAETTHEGEPAEEPPIPAPPESDIFPFDDLEDAEKRWHRTPEEHARRRILARVQTRRAKRA